MKYFHLYPNIFNGVLRFASSCKATIWCLPLWSESQPNCNLNEIITVFAIPWHYLEHSNCTLPRHSYCRTSQTNVLCVCWSSQFVSSINIAMTWGYFSNVISQRCSSNWVSAACLKWKFLRLEIYSDREDALQQSWQTRMFWQLRQEQTWCRTRWSSEGWGGVALGHTWCSLFL